LAGDSAQSPLEIGAYSAPHISNWISESLVPRKENKNNVKEKKGHKGKGEEFRPMFPTV